jgi:catechol 2,3-dioxygenase-like lactoylglutathione lyase family enzyme
METTKIAKVDPVDMKLEVVVLGVSDVDRAKAFYENLGWRLDIDIDIAAGNFRGVQMTPHNSETSIIFGKGITSAKPGSAQSLVLVVDDLASFEDPDGNGWLLQEITTRLPGREWNSTRARATDVAILAERLRETAEHHDHYEKTHAEHHWWDWYAPYLSARQDGNSPEEAAAAARYMEEVIHVLPR